MTIKFFQKYRGVANESGVSLMLAVLVLAAITAIAFSLTTVVMIELRASGDVVRSEPSLYATLGVTEEALFQYKRFVNERADGSTPNPLWLNVPGCDAAPVSGKNKTAVCSLGGVTLALPDGANGDVQPLDYDTTPRVQTVFSGQTVTIPLFTINASTGGTYDPEYGRVNLRLVPANHLDDLQTYLDCVNIFDGTIPPIPVRELDESPQGVTYTEMNTPNYQCELVLDNIGSNENFLVSIDSFDKDDADLGLPFIGRKVLKVVADYLGITRTYMVNIPVGGSGSTGPGGGFNDWIWFEDALPAGAIPTQNPDLWNWVGTDPAPASGSLAHKSGVYGGIHQHYFNSASTTMTVAPGDTLVTYVYMDPANPPRTIMLQWYSTSEGWNHRAYWGEDLIGWGTPGTYSHYNMGSLPGTGTWVRLEIPASVVGLENHVVDGMAFTLYDGQATWDHTGKEQ